MSMFDDMNQMETDGIVDTIAHELFEQWCDANLDEGTMYADYQICQMYGDPSLKIKFNQFYNLKSDDQYYFEVE